MGANNTAMIRKLKTAINSKGYRLLYNTSEFYSADQQRTVTLHTIKQSIPDPNGGKDTVVQLFKSASKIQVVLFLRDFWYMINNQEIPNDNQIWEAKKEKMGIRYDYYTED